MPVVFSVGDLGVFLKQQLFGKGSLRSHTHTCKAFAMHLLDVVVADPDDVFYKILN